MPVQGTVPKPRDQIRHRVPPAFEWVDVPNVPHRGGPTLSNRKRPNGRRWPKQALEKWAVWKAMPHCSLWTAADWQFALDTIEMAAQLYDGVRYSEEGDPLPWSATSLATLMQREKVMGTTLDYRRALRIRYVDTDGARTPPARAGTVADLADYRSL